MLDKDIVEQLDEFYMDDIIKYVEKCGYFIYDVDNQSNFEYFVRNLDRDTYVGIKNIIDNSWQNQ